MSKVWEFGDRIVTAQEITEAFDKAERYEEALRRVEEQLILNCGADEIPDDEVPCVPYIRAVLKGELW